MKLGRNLSAVVTVIVACSLLTGGLAEWQGSHFAGSQTQKRCAFGVPAKDREMGTQDSGIGADWRGALRIIAYCVGAVGVIWLGWYCWRTTGTITSIARQLKSEQPANLKPRANPAINELSEAISNSLESYSNTIKQLQKQIGDLQIQIQLSQRQKRNTEAIIYSLRDAVIVIDEFDRLLMANEAAGKLFNFDFQVSQHKPIGELINSSCVVRDASCEGKERNTQLVLAKAGQAGARYAIHNTKTFVDFLRQSRQSKTQATRREIEFSKDGQLKTYDCIVSCVYDDKQQVCGAAVVLHNVTREKQIQQMKNDFVSHVSHELKTPLASITAYSEMLSDGEADDEETRKEFYSVIQNQAQRLNRLIEDILNISRIESGLIKVNKESVSLTILIEEQLQMIKSAASEKNIEIVGQKPIVYDQVYADKDMISQVIVNLLSNAVKYTRSGGSVKIETEVDEIASLARVSVTDTGVGIPEDEIEHVFDKFYRVGANIKQAKGTGLGLNLVKQIIEKVHNGRVFVTSQLGVGSTFGFELPLATREKVEAA